jgi:hypothetical protein
VVKAPFHPKGGSLKQGLPRIPPRTQPRPTGWTLNLSALGFLLAFAVTAYGGANILAFERLKGRLDSLRGPSIDSMLGPISAWQHTWGVAARARRLALDVVLAETPADITGLESAVDEVVKASPTSIDAWQGRAAYRRARGAPMESVLASFRMSALTGSHEGYWMTQRAIFGLEHWTELPEADRRIVIRDLLATARLPEIGTDPYSQIVTQKSQAERDDIRAAATQSGLGTQGLLQALGM